MKRGFSQPPEHTASGAWVWEAPKGTENEKRFHQTD